MAATSELRPRMQKWAKIIKGVTPPVGSLLTPQSYFCPHRLVCTGADTCSPQFMESQLSGVDSSDAKMPKDEHSSDPGCGVTFDRASWQPFYAPIGGTFFHSTWGSHIQQSPDNHTMLNHTTLLFAPNLPGIKWSVNKFALIIAQKALIITQFYSSSLHSIVLFISFLPAWKYC